MRFGLKEDKEPVNTKGQAGGVATDVWHHLLDSLQQKAGTCFTPQAFSFVLIYSSQSQIFMIHIVKLHTLVKL